MEFNEIFLNIVTEAELKFFANPGYNYFVSPGTRVQFHARIAPDGAIVDDQVIWELSSTDGREGTVTSTGLYTAPDTEGYLFISVSPKPGAPKYKGLAYIIVTPNPAIQTFQANPPVLLSGQSVQLLGQFSGLYSQGWYGTSRILAGTEVVAPSVQSGVPVTITPTATTTYTLEVTNPAGSAMRQDVTVVVAGP